MAALSNSIALADPKLKRSDRDIKDAVKMWNICGVEAEGVYGHISDWDVSEVTDMSELFKSM
jgi:hypothetical protein